MPPTLRDCAGDTWRASGRPFETFLRERIFEPLGMKDTGFSVPPDVCADFWSCVYQAIE